MVADLEKVDVSHVPGGKDLARLLLLGIPGKKSGKAPPAHVVENG